METCFTILKSSILHVIFLQNLPTMNILDPIFYRTLFYDFRPVIFLGVIVRATMLQKLNMLSNLYITTGFLDVMWG